MAPGATDWTALVQTAFLIVFTLAIVGGSITTTARLIRYRLAHQRIPLILWRDVIARTSLAMPFVAIFSARVARASGYDTAPLITSMEWIVATSLPPTLGALIYLYFELFVIERDGDYPDGNGSAGPPA